MTSNYVVQTAIDSFMALNEVASGLVGLLVFTACFHLLFSQYFDNRRREEAFAVIFLWFLGKFREFCDNPTLGSSVLRRRQVAHRFH